MAYGPEVEVSGSQLYEAIFQHTATGITVRCYLESSSATETQKDNVFQGLLSKVSELASVTLVSAVKTTTYSQQVTP